MRLPAIDDDDRYTGFDRFGRVIDVRVLTHVTFGLPGGLARGLA